MDRSEKRILKREDIDAPPHQPGLLPPWLAERGVSVVIAGGMGQRAQELFAEQQVQVFVGASAEALEKIVHAYLEDSLRLEANQCSH